MKNGNKTAQVKYNKTDDLNGDYLRESQWSRMRIALCDDDEKQSLLLRAYITKWAERTGCKVSITVFNSAENFIINWNTPGTFDLLFLDIMMNKMTGVELAELIRKTDTEMDIAFVTATPDFVFKGYDVGALYYLIKPIKEEDCVKCLNKAQMRLGEEEEKSLLVNHEDGLKKVRLSELIYIESLAHYLDYHTTQGVLRTRKNIASAEEELAEYGDFFRIHRSYVVNLKHIDLFLDDEIQLEDGRKLPVSRRKKREAYRAFVSYHANL